MQSSLAGSQPLHGQVRETIATQIRSGVIPPGARLQSERDLAEQMGVSRVTVRRALDALADDGLVRAARGSGRFVGDAALAEPPNVLLSFTELGAQRSLDELAGSRNTRPRRDVRGGRVVRRGARGGCLPALPPAVAQARHLEVTAGSPLLLARTTSYDGSDRVVELGETAYRSDRYRFRATLVRKPKPGGGTIS